MQADADPVAPRRRLGIGALVVVVIVALAITVGIGVVRGLAAPVDTVTVDDPVSEPSVAMEVLHVHVSGAVQSPGLYVLPAGSRVVDAISIAHGLAPDAQRDAVNLARILSDGEQLVVPRVGESSSAAAPVTDGRVNLNTADIGALDTLPRIGAAMAQRIVDWRTTNGRFTSVEDLLAVPGIGDKMLEALRDLVTV